MYKNRAICDVLSTIFWGWLSWIASSTRVVWRRIDLRKKLERSMCGDTLKAYVFTGSNELAGFDSVVNKSSQTIQCILKRYNVFFKNILIGYWVLIAKVFKMLCGIFAVIVQPDSSPRNYLWCHLIHLKSIQAFLCVFDACFIQSLTLLDASTRPSTIRLFLQGPHFATSRLKEFQ